MNYTPCLQPFPPPSSLAFADTGATDHFFTTTANVSDPQPATFPVHVAMPNGAELTSSHTATLPFPDIPVTARTGHILPNLQNSLVAIGKLCDVGYTATFDATSVNISHPQRQAIRGTRHSNGLWTLPLPQPTMQPQMNYSIHDSTTSQIVRFLHRTLFSPTKSTLLQALANNHFVGWPAFNTQTVRRHLTLQPATIMGHMDQQRQNTRPTGETPPVQPTEGPPTPPITDGLHTNDVVLAVTDLPTGRIFSDQTGYFPQVSSRGVKAVMVLYDYDSNSILVEGITSRGATELLRAYAKLHQRLVVAGLRPKFQRLDNEASGAFKTFLQQQQIDFQLTPSSIHRRNAAERAIRTWKNHFIAGLSALDPSFPIRFWCQLLPQSETSLNLLRQSRLNPRLSAYAQLYGNFDFNRTPLAPPGCKTIIFNTPDQRGSWAPHGEVAWYVGPAMDHYRCYTTVSHATGRQRVAETVEFLPHDFQMPQLSSADLAARAATELAKALQNPHPAAPFLPPTQRLNSELQRLADIFTLAQQPATTAPATVPSPGPVPVTPPRRRQDRLAIRPMAPRVINQLLPPRTPPMSIPVPKSSAPATRVQTTPALANAVFDTDTGRNLEYRQLIQHPNYKEAWLRSSANEFGRLAQGVGGRIRGTDTINFIPRSEVPAGRRVTYGRFVCERRPQKEEVERTRLTVGGNLIDYPGDVSSPTADLTTFKLHVNDVLSTPNAKMMSLDISNFYLNTPLDRPEFMKLHISLIPPEIIQEYKLAALADDAGYIHMRINKGMYGLPQAGKLANDLLQRRLAPHGYRPCRYTPGLWRHDTKQLSFVLVVDDFAVKYVNKGDANELLTILKGHYDIKVDWTASLFCGISVAWDYIKRTARLSMPKYIATMLKELSHSLPSKPQFSPHPHNPPKFGADSQILPEEIPFVPLPPADSKIVPHIIGKLMYYGRAVDSTLLVALSSLSSEQNKPSTHTKSKIHQLLDYCATNPDAALEYRASAMILHTHSDAGYHNEPGARSRSGGHHFLTDTLDPLAAKPNGAILNPTTIIRHVASSAAEAETGAAFINCREALPLRITLQEMGYPQPPTPVLLDNTTAHGFITSSIKQKRTRAMDMRYHWLRDREAQQQFKFHWAPAKYNKADYFTKHFPPSHHQQVRSEYVLHLQSSTKIQNFPSEPAADVLRGCANATSIQHICPPFPAHRLHPLDSHARGPANISPLSSVGAPNADCPTRHSKPHITE